MLYSDTSKFYASKCKNLLIDFIDELENLKPKKKFTLQRVKIFKLVKLKQHNLNTMLLLLLRLDPNDKSDC